MSWRRFNGDLIEKDIISAVEETLVSERKKGFRTSICIGTDSQVTSGVTEYATVIVFLRERQGGFMFIKKEKTKQIMALRERMINEVSKSVSIAYELSPVIDSFNVPLEVHADINTDPNHKSHAAFQEAMGYIKGMGFDFKAKPDAFASSYCADKLV